MSVFTALRDYFRKAVPGTWFIDKWQANKPYYPDVSHGELVKKYRGWVYACAHRNAVSCAQVPLRLYVAKPAGKTKALFPTRAVKPVVKKYLAGCATTAKYVTGADDIEEVTEHPIIELLDRANDFMNRFDLLEYMFLSQEITGNAFWVKYRSTLGLPDQIWPLMVHRTDIIPSKTKVIDHYEFKISATEKQIIDPRDMVHFKYVSLTDPYWGMGPLEAAVVAADLSWNMDEYEAYLMQNRAVPDYVIIKPEESGEPGSDEKKAVEKAWYKNYGGIKKAGKMAWLWGGAKIQQVSLSPKDINFLAGRKATLAEIAAIFGVPLSKLTTDDVNRANAEAGDYTYAKDTQLPRLRKAEQKINEQLVPEFDTRLFFAFDNPVPEDKEFRLKETESHLRTAYSSPNEERAVDGWEEVPWGAIPVVSTTTAPLGSTTVQAPEEPTPSKSKSAKRGIGQAPDDIYNLFLTVLRAYFAEIAKMTLARVEADKPVEDMGKAVKERTDDFASAWFETRTWSELLTQQITPAMETALNSAGREAMRAVGGDGAFNPYHQRLLSAMRVHRHGAIQSVNETALKTLRGVLGEGLAENEGWKQLQKRLLEQFEQFEKYSAERIARTESAWAWNRGALEGYQQSGVEYKQWDSAIDERSCAWCEALDGVVIGVDVNWFEKGGHFPLPDDPNKVMTLDYEDVGHPPLHSNCRCAIVPVIGEP